MWRDYLNPLGQEDCFDPLHLRRSLCPLRAISPPDNRSWPADPGATVSKVRVLDAEVAPNPISHSVLA